MSHTKSRCCEWFLNQLFSKCNYCFEVSGSTKECHWLEQMNCWRRNKRTRPTGLNIYYWKDIWHILKPTLRGSSLNNLELVCVSFWTALPPPWHTNMWAYAPTHTLLHEYTIASTHAQCYREYVAGVRIFICTCWTATSGELNRHTRDVASALFHVEVSWAGSWRV